MLPRPYQVTAISRETANTYTLRLKPVDATPAGNFRPGQFNMLYVFGIGEVPISISGDPADTEEWCHTVRDVGAVTYGLCHLKRGSCVGLRGPYGSSWPIEEAVGYDVVIVAGGLGLAPLRPVIYHILRNRSQYGHVVLLYGARTPGDRLYQRQLAQWARNPDIEVHQVVDVATPGWRGHVGVVTSWIGHAHFDPLHAIAMVCGPEVMMRYAILELNKHGVASENIYLSLERNMKCAVGFCGHCQYGPAFICKDGPVLRYDRIAPFFQIREL